MRATLGASKISDKQFGVTDASFTMRGTGFSQRRSSLDDSKMAAAAVRNEELDRLARQRRHHSVSQTFGLQRLCEWVEPDSTVRNRGRMAV